MENDTTSKISNGSSPVGSSGSLGFGGCQITSIGSDLGCPHSGTFESRLNTEKYGLQPIREARPIATEYFEMNANYWLPHDASCPPSQLTGNLASSVASNDPPSEWLSWLQDRTVVIVGDSVDRGHLHQFCDLVGGNASIVMADDPISPPPFRDGKQELLKLVNGEPATGSILTRPRICRIPKYNFLMISTFQFGMMEGEQYPAEWWERDEHYYAPFVISDRLEHIVMPILKSLGRKTIDLLELGSCFWDVAWLNSRLRMDGHDTSFASVPQADLQEHAQKISRNLRKVAGLGMARDAKTVLFRTAHHPGESFNGYIPSDVVEQVDSVAQEVVKALQGEKTANSPWFASSNWTAEMEDAARLDFGNRLRLDYSGKMMDGQTKHQPDNLHPNPLPNGKLWSDILLYEIRRLADL